MSEKGSQGHESRDIDFKKIVLSGLVFFGFAIGAALVGLPAFSALMAHTRTPPLWDAPEKEVSSLERVRHTQLDAESGKELSVVRAEEARHLESYSWIDQQNGVVRIPIDRAIELSLERGLLCRPEVERPPIYAEDGRGDSNGHSQGGKE